MRNDGHLTPYGLEEDYAHQRHAEKTVFYRVLFHCFEKFLREYKNRFEREYGYFRPVIKKVVEKFLDCGNPKCGFCPSCHAKRLEEWSEWMREELLLEVAHRQVVFVIPKMLRVFFKYKRKLLGELCRCAIRALLRYFELHAESALTPGVIAVIQTFGDRINRHPYIHCLVTEGGEDGEGRFHHLPAFSDGLLAQIFSREVFALLLQEKLISEALVEKIASWRHSGFSVHSQVKASTREEAERVGKYMIRPLLSLERLSFSEKEGKVCYRYGKEAEEVERMDYLEFIARVTSHIPDKGQVTIHYFGLYANAHRGKVRRSGLGEHQLLIVEEACPRIPRRGWAKIRRKVYEVDPMICPKCQGEMKVISFITDYSVVDRIINHLKLSFVADKPPPPQVAFQELLMAAQATHP